MVHASPEIVVNNLDKFLLCEADKDSFSMRIADSILCSVNFKCQTYIDSPSGEPTRGSFDSNLTKAGYISFKCQFSRSIVILRFYSIFPAL